MPKISIPIKNGYPAESVINMAETLAKLTGTAVECRQTVEVTANEAVIKALTAIAPMAKAKRNKRSKEVTEEGSEDPQEVSEAG